MSSVIERFHDLDDLRASYADCMRCTATRKEIAETSTGPKKKVPLDLATWRATRPLLTRAKIKAKVVMGSGAATARMMFVGEAPGIRETKTGIPFVGDSGCVLMDQLCFHRGNLIDPRLDAYRDYIVDKINDGKDGRLDDDQYPEVRAILEEHIYFTNTVMCEPPKDRKPQVSEVKMCRKRLWEEIRLVDPMLIVALGSYAVKSLLGDAFSVTSHRGKVYKTHIPGLLLNNHSDQPPGIPYPVLVAYHPSYVMRTMTDDGSGNPGLDFANDIRQAVRLYHTYRKNLEA